jgi:hypothetical protein
MSQDGGTGGHEPDALGSTVRLLPGRGPQKGRGTSSRQRIGLAAIGAAGEAPTSDLRDQTELP